MKFSQIFRMNQSFKIEKGDFGRLIRTIKENVSVFLKELNSESVSDHVNQQFFIRKMSIAVIYHSGINQYYQSTYLLSIDHRSINYDMNV